MTLHKYMDKYSKLISSVVHLTKANIDEVLCVMFSVWVTPMMMTYIHVTRRLCETEKKQTSKDTLG